MCALPRLRSSSDRHLPRQQSILVLLGPTASGKTAVSIPLAQRLDAEILSADSRQVYKLLDIGTAKPTEVDRRKVKHYFVDEIMPEDHFDAAEFGDKGRMIIEDIFHRGKTPIVVGGSGLYIQGLVDGFFDGPPADAEIRKQLERRIAEEGAGVLLEELRRVDPVSASRMHEGFHRRIVRALEVYHLTGIPISRLQEKRVEIKFRKVLVGLEWPRALLYRRINERVDRMIAGGLIEEVGRLKDLGYSTQQKGLQTTGYAEVFPYLDGKISRDKMIELVKRNTRRYAKRQLTWFRHDERIHWVRVDDEAQFAGVAMTIYEYFQRQREGNDAELNPDA